MIYSPVIIHIIGKALMEPFVNSEQLIWEPFSF